jgi:hypothetical protein
LFHFSPAFSKVPNKFELQPSLRNIALFGELRKNPDMKEELPAGKE